MSRNKIFVMLILSTLISYSFAAVLLTVNGLNATVSNGNLQIAFNADATVSSVNVNNVNIAASVNQSFYLDWHANGRDFFAPIKLNVVENTSSRAHFYWTQPSTSTVFRIELHYVMIEGVNGIYSWAKYTNDQSSNITLGETRVVYAFKQWILTEGTNTIRSGTLYLYDYLIKQTFIQDETWQLPDGTYYTKYDYANFIRETPYQGVYGNGYGAFVISPSREYHGGGPNQQDLIVHQDSLITNYFVSSHFGGVGLNAPPGWSHIYGPWLVYFTTGSDSQILSDVAKRYQTEKSWWPYDFVGDDDYPTKRGSVSGRVTGQTAATVALYDSTNEELETQCLGYVYHVNTDSKGQYTISNIRPGTYKVIAYPLAGQGSENTATTFVTVGTSNVNVDTLNLPEPSNIIWSIGQANRKSNEFKYSNESRNYLYSTLPPKTLTFTIDSSSEANDWYYAQTQPGIWTINYEDTQDGNGRTFRIAIAAASHNPFRTTIAADSLISHLIVNLNNHKIGDVSFSNDKSIYRGAMQSGSYYSNVFKANNAQVVTGTNVLTLEITEGEIMYDAISLQRN